MGRPRIAVAAGNELGTEAAASVARQGGNAVDACLAAAVMGWVAEPFFASVGGSGFVIVRTPDGEVEVIDGNNTMPTTPPRERGQGIRRVFLEYSDGMYTGIGAGSIGVPGILAAAHRAWERHGKIEWAAILQPAIAAAREGLPFPRTSAYYLSVTWNEIWSGYPEAAALFGPEGRPLEEGEPFVQRELADSLQLIADKGPEVFYEGELARAIADSIAADDGFITVEDLKAYEPIVRVPLKAEAFGWTVETNPPPSSVGGILLLQTLGIMENAAIDDAVSRLRAFTEAQRTMMDMREELFAEPDTIAADIDADVHGTAHDLGPASPETTHASSADADGYLCAITESNAYGAGLVVQGMLFNNTLGEEELNPLGPHMIHAGARCHSNMAPTIAYTGDKAVSIGSPGATRIVGAVAQALLRMMIDGDPLERAVAAPRSHLDPRADGPTLCYEPGLPGDAIPGYLLRPYDEIHMYFGAVQAAGINTDGSLAAAHDPRRSGGSALI